MNKIKSQRTNEETNQKLFISFPHVQIIKKILKNIILEPQLG